MDWGGPRTSHMGQGTLTVLRTGEERGEGRGIGKGGGEEVEILNK